jgi:predicted DCC family thiol-disulfide oxidoreductase YuxK
MAAWKLYYDGGCNLCHASRLRIHAWAQRAGRPMEYETLQSPEAAAKGYGDAMVLEADGEVLTGADAWLKLMDLAPGPLRVVGWLGRIPGLRSVLKLGYRIVARYRYRWFGTRACPLPGKQV